MADPLRDWVIACTAFARLAEDEAPATYQIIRFYRDERPSETIETGLTIEQVEAHCSGENAHTEDWFDGYAVD